jgi:dynein light chain LC8-type
MDAAGVALPEPVLLHVDLSEAARAVCLRTTLEAMSKHRVEKDIATHVKKALEAWNGALWVVVVGVSFGASVAHENQGLLLFRVGKVHVLCFQCFDEGALINTKKDVVRVAAQAKKPDEEEKEEAEPAAA